MNATCKRCNGGGEVLSASIAGWGNRHDGTFSPCPDCRGLGFIPFVDTPEANEAREAVPGETREQARARLSKFRGVKP